MGTQSAAVAREPAKQSSKELIHSPAVPVQRKLAAPPATAIPTSFGAISVLAPGERQPVIVPLQRKLTIGAVDDPLERDADTVAERVMNMSGRVAAMAGSAALPLRRKCACEGSGAKCDQCKNERENTLQRKAASSVTSTEAPPIVREALRSPSHQCAPALQRACGPDQNGTPGDCSPVQGDVQGEGSAVSDNGQDGVIKLAQVAGDAGGSDTSGAAPASSSAPSCKFEITYGDDKPGACPTGYCGASMTVTPTQICGTGPDCPSLAGLTAEESVTSDHGCSSGNPTTGGGWTIRSAPGLPATCGKFFASSDTLTLCMDPKKVPDYGCTETYRQVVGVGGTVAEKNTITFSLNKSDSACGGIVVRNKQSL